MQQSYLLRYVSFIAIASSSVQLPLDLFTARKHLKCARLCEWGTTSLSQAFMAVAVKAEESRAIYLSSLAPGDSN